MAAPRKYTRAQRDAMFRLFEVGIGPTEIARKCAAGGAGVDAFEIPRKTCEAIVKEMQRATAQHLPTTLDEAESAGAVERFPVRITGIVGAELDRLEKKQKRRGLSVEDFEVLKKASALTPTLQRRLSHGRIQGTRGSQEGRQPAGPPAPKESALEKLAREQGEGSGEEDRPSPTHTQSMPAKSQAETPDPVVRTNAPGGDRVLAAVQGVMAKHGVELGDLGVVEKPVPPESERSPIKRAREALGYPSG